MFCPSCGKELPDGSSFCLHCGKPTTATAQAPAKEKTGVPILRIIGIGALLLLLVGMLLSRMSSSTSNQQLLKEVASQQPVLVAMSNKLFTGQIVVNACSYVGNKMTVEPSRNNFHVVC